MKCSYQPGKKNPNGEYEQKNELTDRRQPVFIWMSNRLRENLVQVRQIKRPAAERMRAFFIGQERHLVFWICTGQVLTGRAGIFRNYDNDIFYAGVCLHAFQGLCGWGIIPIFVGPVSQT
jgi:hypothetical protein